MKLVARLSTISAAVVAVLLGGTPAWANFYTVYDPTFTDPKEPGSHWISHSYANGVNMSDAEKAKYTKIYEYPNATQQGVLQECENYIDDNNRDTGCFVSYTPKGQLTRVYDTYHQVGDTVANCAPTTSDYSLAWSDTTSTTNSFSVSLTVEATLYKVVKVAVQTTYGYSTTHTHTAGQTTTMHVNPFSIGWVERASLMERVTGDYMTQTVNGIYGIPTLVHDATISTPVPDVGSLVIHVRPMTTDEQQSICGMTGLSMKTLPGPAPAGTDATPETLTALS